ncbi:MAG: molybdopterin-guanine dinucleotide biosynthesis protein B, partial [Hyphomicrobiaceae bacterium]
VEGYKSAPIYKIEVRRRASATQRSLAFNDPLVFAIAADHEVAGETVPVLSLDDIAGIMAAIEARVGPLAGRRATAEGAALDDT